MKGRLFTRRQAMATLAAGSVGTFALRQSWGKDDRPNIIFILSDDHRYDAFGFMNKPWLPTPHLDRLAHEGIHFQNSFVTTSLCSPSRASFLTGQYARCHGIIHNLTPWTGEHASWLELLHAQGYHTAFIGKWHMPGKGVPDLVGEGKVDRMVSFSIGGGQGVYNDCPLIVDGQTTRSHGYITDVLTQYALEFLEERRSGPFCLYLSHKAVHAYFVPPPRHEGRLAGAPLHEREKNVRNFPLGAVHVPQLKDFQQNQQRYYEALLGVDDSVGAILEFLDDKGLAENTLVVYAGDNGYFWGEHGLIDKRYAYEEGIRIPHLARFPRYHTEYGRAVDAMILNIDLMPTLLQAAGISVPSSVQGQSWLPFFASAPRQWRTSWLYEYFSDPGLPHPPIKALRTPEWKFITYPGAEKRFPAEMYYLVEDPGERLNLADDPSWAAKKAELEAELARLDQELSCARR